ncbi:hypothetical protein L210DRAFT_3653500 [Boletus edulis BED1]|uniref:Uncharacterized protein n=1 Tax=Boletus edulis BED1 TaxID=1328754 RepID=A0AAD4BET1_BOLED|nr:hypothetical protein L210DRAFT_3653500 [Boletus edulis BED1]
MIRSHQRLLSQLATSHNELASGLGQCLEAFRLISALPRASSVFVKYTSTPSPTTKTFAENTLSRPSSRHGTIDPSPVLLDEDSWKELAPYVHTLHVADDLEHPSIALCFTLPPPTTNGPPVAGHELEFEW